MCVSHRKWAQDMTLAVDYTVQLLISHRGQSINDVIKIKLR